VRAVQALGGVEAHAAGERQLMRSVATANPKNYQLWNHRRRVALALGPGQAEEVGLGTGWGRGYGLAGSEVIELSSQLAACASFLGGGDLAAHT
jgi:hypothetical protein